jgi:hypothetical protein
VNHDTNGTGLQDIVDDNQLEVELS